MAGPRRTAASLPRAAGGLVTGTAGGTSPVAELIAEVQWRFFFVARGKHGVFLGKYYFSVARIAQD